MATLYEGQMAEIYEIMYQHFIDYDAEYNFYKNLLEQYNCLNTVEIGAGTGQLALRFSQNNFPYQGVDYSNDMLEIAKRKCPNTTLILGDMKTFALNSPVDSIIMTGRTSSYIISNHDLNQTFKNFHKNLNDNKILIFDFIDANRYIPFILQNKNIEHKVITNDATYSRIANWFPTDFDNFLLNWKATYYIEKNGVKNDIQEDFSTVRVFTKDEMILHLTMNGYTILEMIDRKTYAYDTYVVVAQKK